MAEKIRIYRTKATVLKIKRGRRQKYPFDEMGVGDAFDADATYQTLYSSIRHWLKRVCADGAGCPEFQIVVEGQKSCKVIRTK